LVLVSTVALAPVDRARENPWPEYWPTVCLIPRGVLVRAAKLTVDCLREARIPPDGYAPAGSRGRGRDRWCYLAISAGRLGAELVSRGTGLAG